MNDNDLEQKLQTLSLASPSAELDRRMNDLFASASPVHRRTRKAHLWWSLAAVSVLGTAATFLVLPTHRPLPETPGQIYRFEAAGALRQMLLEPPARQQTPPALTVRTSTE